MRKIYNGQRYKYGVGMIVFFMLSGCYKKDLNEFQNIKSINYESEVAFPLFNCNLTLNDTIPYLEYLQPLNINENFIIADTFNVDELAILEDSFKAPIEYVEFKFHIINSFPANGNLQFYFLNSRNKFVDSLFRTTTETLNPGTNNQYMETTLYFYMDRDKYKRIIHAPKIQVSCGLKTEHNTRLTGYYLIVEAGVRAKFKTTITK
jgi:hypothetical protein